MADWKLETRTPAQKYEQREVLLRLYASWASNPYAAAYLDALCTEMVALKALHLRAPSEALGYNPIAAGKFRHALERYADATALGLATQPATAAETITWRHNQSIARISPFIAKLWPTTPRR